MQTLTVAGLQYDLAWEDPQANCMAVARYLKEQLPPPGSLVALPEMFSTGFTMNPAAVAQRPGGPVERFLAGAAAGARITLVAGLAVALGDGRFANESVVFDPSGATVARYRKQRPFTPGGEAQHYQAGTDPVVFAWGGLNVGAFVCYDLRFPELFRVATARARPDLFVVIASWPDKRVAHWVKLLQARAIENQAYVLGVNRVGADPSHRYTGRSIVVNPSGDIVADAGESAGWVTATLEIDALREYRVKLPFLDDQAR